MLVHVNHAQNVLNVSRESTQLFMTFPYNASDEVDSFKAPAVHIRCEKTENWNLCI